MAKLSFNVDDMLPRLAQAVGIVNSKNPMPILGDVVFKTSANGENQSFTIMTSDSETWLTINVPSIEFDEDMKFCVLAADIFRMLSTLKGKVVEMVLDNDTHTIKCSYGNGRFQLPFESADEFPHPMMDMSDAVTKELNAANLMRALGKTSFAIANDKLRPIMNGVHFDFFEYGMVAVATDGQKLAKLTDKTILGDETTHGFTLPKKPATTLVGLLADCDTMVTLTFNDKAVTCANGEFVLQTRLLEGKYPNYDRVIPKDNTIETCINRTELIDALKRVMPMGNAASELVDLSFMMGLVTVKAEDFSFSKSADESIECDYASQEMSIGFNGSWMLDVLQSIDDVAVKACLRDKTRAGIFKPVAESADEEYVTVLMPIFLCS